MNADAERGLRGPLAYAIHASFFVLLSTSGVRYVTVHGTSGRFGVVLVLAVVLALLYAVMATVSSRDVVRQRLWMWPVLSAWAALVWLAPSFAWCAFPVLFLCIRLYPSKIAYPLVGILGVLAGVAFYRVTGRAELVTLLGPLCTAALVAAAYGQMERDARERLRLLRQVAEAQSALADTERAAGVAAERERLAREIHDTVTQGLASALLRLEAAEQTWNTTGSPSRADVDAAAENIRTSLMQSRDLRPFSVRWIRPACDAKPRRTARRIVHRGKCTGRRHRRRGPVPSRTEDPVTTTIRVFLVDDHLVVRAGLRALLNTQPDVEVVGEASSGEEAATAIPSASPDLVMMDLDMGTGMHGAEAIKRLRSDGVDVPVLVFTTYDTDADVVRAVDAGAIGYLLKDSTPDEIFGAVRGALAGRSVLSPAVASRLVQQMQRPQEALTARESELLSLLAEGMTNRELGKALFISEATVKTHLGHIYAKLGVDNRSAAVSVALRRDGIR